MIEVRRLTLDDCTWNWRDDSATWRPPYGGGARFDPFPAYPHEADAVAAAVGHVHEVLPPLWPITVYIADREEVARSNGYSDVHEGRRYEDGEWVSGTPSGVIVLSGKRIPPHSAVTRYLVAHEYGHHVEWMIQYARDVKTITDDTTIKEYAAARTLPEDAVHPGSGGRWHDSAAEIFACDFRILVCGVEPEYWPHPGIPRPEETGIADWWAGALADIDVARTPDTGS